MAKKTYLGEMVAEKLKEVKDDNKARKLGLEEPIKGLPSEELTTNKMTEMYEQALDAISKEMDKKDKELRKKQE